jgi:DNA-binding NarL/FixJ family response regulator
LLAHHLSNPAIRQRLFVSPKTVEHHVSAILTRLDVATRDEACSKPGAASGSTNRAPLAQSRELYASAS